MTTSGYIRVGEDESDDPMELELEPDGNLLISTLSGQFPTACGLKYRNPESGALRGLRVGDGKIYPPADGWKDHLYVAVFPKENTKRKMEEQSDRDATSGTSNSKQKRVDKRRCSDLIVLGIPYSYDESALQQYFEQFGEVVVSQVKRDGQTGKSKGFGFVRFADYDSQLRVLSQRHQIEGRSCDVKIPNSKETVGSPMSRKVFVGRISESITVEDLRQFFSKYGEVIDVFIPRPFRAFAFVTFDNPDVAHSLCGEDYVIKGTSVHVSTAVPKHDNHPTGHGGGGGHHQSSNGHSPQYHGGHGSSRGDRERDMFPPSRYESEFSSKAARTSPWMTHPGGSSEPPPGYSSSSSGNWSIPQQQTRCDTPVQVPPPNITSGTNQATLGMGALNINPILSAVAGIQALLSSQGATDLSGLLTSLQTASLAMSNAGATPQGYQQQMPPQLNWGNAGQMVSSPNPVPPPAESYGVVPGTSGRGHAWNQRDPKSESY